MKYIPSPPPPPPPLPSPLLSLTLHPSHPLPCPPLSSPLLPFPPLPSPFPYQLDLCDQPLTELSNPGASGSLFYISGNDEFIIKTVQKKETEFLQKLLPGYYLVSLTSILCRPDVTVTVYSAATYVRTCVSHSFMHCNKAPNSHLLVRRYSLRCMYV